ncbi:MAG TPA: hypothetical protein VGG16_02250 [Streptosporangiaceae bacterium]|jgi:hypothetical protein
MVCYARRAAWIAICGIIVLVMLGADQTHLFNVVGLMMTLAIVLGGAATGAGLTVLALRSVQHKRAATGACVTCRFQCQHAMTPPPAQRGWLISTADRGAAREKVFVPMPRIPVRDQAGPQWPDQPLITTASSDS